KMLLGFALVAGVSASPALAQQPAPPQQERALPRAEMWMLLPLFEANRPVITQRKLSGAEKSEAKKLSKAYIDYRTMNTTRTMAALARMRELASSGDKDAMIAIREALQEGDAPLDYIAKFDPRDKDNWFFKYLAQVQAAQWTAEIWSLYGYEDAGRQSINA